MGWFLIVINVCSGEYHNFLKESCGLFIETGCSFLLVRDSVFSKTGHNRNSREIRILLYMTTEIHAKREFCYT